MYDVLSFIGGDMFATGMMVVWFALILFQVVIGVLRKTKKSGKDYAGKYFALAGMTALLPIGVRSIILMMNPSDMGEMLDWAVIFLVVFLAVIVISGIFTYVFSRLDKKPMRKKTTTKKPGSN